MEYFSIQELDLPSDVWSAFAEHYAAVHYVANQMVYFQGSKAEYFYYLKKGRVKTFISSEDGYEKSLTIYREGNLFGEAAFFDELPRISSAIAITDCEIVHINRQQAQNEIAHHPELAMALMKYLARTVRLLSEHIDNMAFFQTDQRMIRYLLSLPRDNNCILTCTQEEIASAVSANRVTVSRILKKFAQSGYLKTGYGFIQLLDIDALKAKISSNVC